MKFKNVSEVFNHYNNKTVTEIEARATEIRGLINTDSTVDIDSLNIELEGLKQAKENIELRATSGTDKRFNPITGMSFEEKIPGDNDIFGSTEYRSAFFKSILGKNLNDMEQKTLNRALELQKAENRAGQFNTMTDSVSVLPTTTLNEVIKRAKTIGGLMGEVRAFNMPTSIAIPVGTPTSKALWHKEGKNVDSEKVETASVKFGAFEILKIFSMSVATKTMSISAFESYLVEELTTAVMECIADSLINGSGTDQGTGLDTGITWDNTNTIDFTGTVKYTDFTKAMALLKRGYSTNAKWAMNNATLYNQVYSVVDGNSRPIFIQDPKNESIGHILGKQVVIDDNIADNVIYLGDFKYMAYNMPRGIILEVSRESSFSKGLIDYRALAIADTKPILPEAFIKLNAKAKS